MVSVEPMVRTKWLHDAIAEQGEAPASSSTSSSPSPSKVCVLDATWQGIMTEGRDAYRSSHIPGSRHFDLNECREKTSRLHFTVPTGEQFAEYVGNELGIDNDTHVIVYENDPIFRLMSAPRVWWMFRLFGHEKVSVLDGGLKQWQTDGYPVESGVAPAVEPRVFKAKEKDGRLFLGFERVLENHRTGDFTLVDARQPEWFDGSMASIWPDLPLGHIVKSVNVPFGSLIRADCDCMVSQSDIRSLFKSCGVDLTRPMVTSCFVGISACTVALAAYVIGERDVAVYDGSWDEFCKKAPAMPVSSYRTRSNLAYMD